MADLNPGLPRCETTMISRAWSILDNGFLVGLVFALLLEGKIVLYLVLVGIVPIVLFRAKHNPTAMLMRFLLPHRLPI
jgi:hypothetical protein